MIIEINNQTKDRINKAIVKKVAGQFLKAYKHSNAEISIAFISEARIRQLNKKYRGKDKITDVLSFSGEGNYLGEILISLKQIKRQAKLYKNSVQQELVFILIHGLLHLAGFNDKTEKGRKEMDKLGNKFIKKYIGTKNNR